MIWEGGPSAVNLPRSRRVDIKISFGEFKGAFKRV